MEIAEEYGDTPPWHDVQAAISGPGRARRRDRLPRALGGPDPAQPQPVDYLKDRLTGLDLSPDPLPEQAPPPPAGRGRRRTSSSCCGPTRTCGSAATTRSRGAASAASPAATPRRSSGRRACLYVEDQYLWGHHVGNVFTEALRDHPDLHVIAVVPLLPGPRRRLPGAAAARPAPRDARDDARPRPDRVAVYGIENHAGHAGLRARQGLRHRRRLGHDRLRQLQPPVLDPRLRAVRGRRRPRPASTPAGSG